MYVPVAHVIGLTHAPFTKAEVELQPHLPGTGVLVVKEVTHFVQYPVLLTAEQFYGILTQVLVPSLYFPVGHSVNVDEQEVPPINAWPAEQRQAPLVSVNVALHVVQAVKLVQAVQFDGQAWH